MSKPDNTAARRVLLVSYWFPPDVGAAAERIGSFARYLPEHGWGVRVLTAGRPSEADESSSTSVHRVRDPFSSGRQPFADYDPRMRPSGLGRRLGQALFLDRFAGWRVAAYRRGINILRQQRFDLILASFPPASVVKLALGLHKSTGVPLVLDYRDQWFGPGGYEPSHESSRRRHEALEREAVGAAMGATAVSDAMAADISRRFGFDSGRVLSILNGFEPAEPPPVVATPARGKNQLLVAHVGTVIARNRPDLFFKSLVQIKGDLRLRHPRFRFVGNLSREYLRAASLGDIVESTGLLSRERARAEMFGADALLLLTGGYVGHWGYNAKLFEYLQAGRPILCLEESPGTSNDRRLLEQHAGERSFFAAVKDSDGIARCLGAIRAYQASASPGPIEPDLGLQKYSRGHQASRLAQFLGQLVESAGVAK